MDPSDQAGLLILSVNQLKSCNVLLSKSRYQGHLVDDKLALSERRYPPSFSLGIFTGTSDIGRYYDTKTNMIIKHCMNEYTVHRIKNTVTSIRRFFI
jgi:hypothetical protein